MAAHLAGRDAGSNDRGRGRTGFGPTVFGRTSCLATALAATALLLGACTTGSPGSSSGGASASPPSSSPSAAASGPSAQGGDACRTADLGVKVVLDPGRHAAGSTYYPVVFTNTAGVPCGLTGYPDVALASSQGGAAIGPAASHDGAATPPVTLQPGDAAHVILQVANADVFDPQACGPVDAPHWLLVAAPGGGSPVYLPFTIETRACSKGGQLGVSAFAPGTGG